MTITQAAHYLNVKPAKIHQLIRVGVLHAWGHGRHVDNPGVYIHWAKLRRLVEQETAITREHRAELATVKGLRNFPDRSKRHRPNQRIAV